MSAREVQDRARWWSYRRQRLGDDRASDASSALRAVVAVYSAHPTGPLSLQARAASFDAVAFRRLDEERVALRVPAMRGSIHLLPRETAHLAFRVTAFPAERQGWRLRDAGISDGEYGRLREERSCQQPGSPAPRGSCAPTPASRGRSPRSCRR